MVGVVLLPLPVKAVENVVGIEIAGRREVLVAVPLDPFAKLEGIAQTVGGGRPRFSQTRNNLGRARLELGQPVVNWLSLSVKIGARRMEAQIKTTRTAFRTKDQSFGRGRLACRDAEDRGDGGNGHRAHDTKFHFFPPVEPRRYLYALVGGSILLRFPGRDLGRPLDALYPPPPRPARGIIPRRGSAGRTKGRPYGAGMGEALSFGLSPDAQGARP